LTRLLEYAKRQDDEILIQATRTVTHATSGGFDTGLARAWAKRMTAFEVVSLARTVARFSGKGGGPDPLGMLRGSVGLDNLDVESDEEGGTTIGAGKYISDKVYLEVESGSGDTGGGANLQVEITPNVKVESKAGQDASGGGIFWQWEY
jgi:translocation and assembly module TamB